MQNSSVEFFDVINRTERSPIKIRLFCYDTTYVNITSSAAIK